MRNCQYDLFRRISLNELGWRVLDKHNRILEPATDLAKKPEIEKSESRNPDQEIQKKESFSRQLSQPVITEPISNSALAITADDAKHKSAVKSKDEPFVWDIYWADSGMTPHAEFMQSVGSC